ncbi:hypothetical protein IMZ31_23255 (plasmid) [Pontibacillus sp. ALD_SL1]|uniref:hypothetical protein n=1 Tax=Pontibacillus sp. ALD_SL1 TaxID=2777185 RepID=UPI001A96B289|nr:hypothetical protein [Pontibacillus sp. ALD_SL1]QST02371.1 hypothetical protein IMZ31_23255 [Pontibacillus sp. ALD_SL1]
MNLFPNDYTKFRLHPIAKARKAHEQKEETHRDSYKEEKGQKKKDLQNDRQIDFRA